jgi:hypothetical protein
VSLRTIQALIAELQAACSAAGQRVDRAAFLLIARRMERSESGNWWVGGEEPARRELLAEG